MSPPVGLLWPQGRATLMFTHHMLPQEVVACKPLLHLHGNVSVVSIHLLTLLRQVGGSLNESEHLPMCLSVHLHTT